MRLQVYCAGAVKAAVTAAASDARQGAGANFTYGPVGKLKQAILSVGDASVMILNRPALEALEAAGKVEPGTIRVIGTVAVGIVLRKGHASIDVSSADALRAALLAAESITYGDPANGDSSGVHFRSVIDRLGIARDLKSRTVLAAMGLAVVDKVARGDVELGATQSSIILGNGDVILAGLLPPDLQHFTHYAVGLARGAGAEARDLYTAVLEAGQHATLKLPCAS